MSAKKFKFISPGIFLNEIDNSQLPSVPAPVGPVVIGQTEKGPAMRPVRVESFADFVELYGTPNPGGNSTDVWRNEGVLTPTYASYAAQAWLKNSPTINVIRLLGKEHTNKSTGGEAGWKLSGTLTSSFQEGGLAHADGVAGAYGLWVFPSKMSGTRATRAAGSTSITGTLAAVWYMEEGSIGLIGGDATGSHDVSHVSVAEKGGAGAFVQSVGTTFKARVTSSDYGYEKTFEFNFIEGDGKFIRNIFNTNPTKTNTSVTSDTEPYWLGETYEREVVDTSIVTGSNADDLDAIHGTGSYFGCILGLRADGAQAGDASYSHARRRIPFAYDKNSQTGWYFAQNLNTVADFRTNAQQKLFKFHGLDHGTWVQNNLKVSIANLRYSPTTYSNYGKFDVVIRSISDKDKAPVILERFSNCNLNPNSENYIARKIGDQFAVYDSNGRKHITKGQYRNNSRYIRVEMNADIDAGGGGLDESLPFGVHGPIKYHDFIMTGSKTYLPADGIATTDATASIMAWGATGSNRVKIEKCDQLVASATADALAAPFLTGALVRFRFPEVALRTTSEQDDPASMDNVYFGAWTGKTSTNSTYYAGITDQLKAKAEAFDQFAADDIYTQYQWVFTLDDISGSGTGAYAYASGTCILGDGITSASYKDAIDAGLDSFTTVFAGGANGLDITEKNPLRNGLLTTGATEKTSYVFNTYKEAIDLISDAEDIDYNLATVPGLTHAGLTSHLIETVEARGDALAIIDIQNDFQPDYEDHEGRVFRTSADLNSTISTLKDRGLNSSYGCAYYPWVQIRDTLYGNFVYVPPSIVAIGAMSYTDRVKAPWFAPAGFNRGGLSSGIAGLPVIAVTHKLTAKERDKLYDMNVNPIASFPSEGIVVFGQKTLQVTRSALDRINVRRLLLFVKRGIAAISKDVLFEPNVTATWEKFINRADPFLQDVKSRFGLTEYKLILDETTTTADLIDQNIMYAKIFLKPARAIEFIAVDFIITNTGAAFED